MLKINKTYCINLDRRPDRWDLVKAQFDKHGLEIERFAAIDGNDFAKQTKSSAANNGCTLSHYFLIERAKLMGFDAVMILEDDVILAENFTTALEDTLHRLPADWDMLLFGGSHKIPPDRINSHILKANRTLTTHGYIMRSSMFVEALNCMSELDSEVDGYTSMLQTIRNVYVADPPLAWQREDYSDIQGRRMNYDHLKTNEQ